MLGKDFIIEATILTEYARGGTVFVTRTPLNIIRSDFLFDFKSFHFPVKLCFNMIISNAKGQSL